MASAMSFLSQQDKDDLSSVFEVLHDTFKREMFAYSDGELTIISHDPNYNSLFSNHDLGDGISSIINPVKTSFYGRIYYEQKQNLRVTDFGDQSALKLNISDGTVRVKVDDAGKAIFMAAKKIEIDGAVYEKNGTPRPHGLFSPQFTTFHLKKVD
jgi:hypothetical protein